MFAMTNMGEKMTEDEVREIVSDELGGGPMKIEDFAKIIMARI